MIRWAQRLGAVLAVSAVALAHLALASAEAPQAAAPPAPVALPADVQQNIERAITTEMARQSIPAVSIAVAVDGVVRWANGYGIADLENYVPAKASTVYRVASVTKPITATAVMQLVQAGKIDLDAPVQRYVPTFPLKPWPLTLRHLLSHASGISPYEGEERDSTKYYATLTEGLELFKARPLLFEPGTRYKYSTYNYNLLGIAVEAASGTSYFDYVRSHVLRPAGMDHVVVDEVAAIIPNRAQGYIRLPSGELRNSHLADTSYKIPGGGLDATVVDLARFAVAFQAGALVPPETVDQMWTPYPATVRTPKAGGDRLAYGIGWMLRWHEGVREILHTGNQQRVTNLLYLRPDRKQVVALMTNLEYASLIPLARQISDMLTAVGSGQ